MADIERRITALESRAGVRTVKTGDELPLGELTWAPDQPRPTPGPEVSPGQRRIFDILVAMDDSIPAAGI
jgi:hypothetical protein